MINFLLGISIAFNIIFILGIILYLKIKEKLNFFNNDNSVVDKDFAKSFWDN